MTPEAKRRKNQKKKLKQRQKKNAALSDTVKLNPDEEASETSGTVEPKEELIVNEDSTVATGLSSEQSESQLAEQLARDSDIIESIKLDQGTSITEQLEKKLSHEVTIMEDTPVNGAQSNTEVVEADHNIAVPQIERRISEPSNLAQHEDASGSHSPALEQEAFPADHKESSAYAPGKTSLEEKDEGCGLAGDRDQSNSVTLMADVSGQGISDVPLVGAPSVGTSITDLGESVNCRVKGDTSSQSSDLLQGTEKPTAPLEATFMESGSLDQAAKGSSQVDFEFQSDLDVVPNKNLVSDNKAPAENTLDIDARCQETPGISSNRERIEGIGAESSLNNHTEVTLVRTTGDSHSNHSLDRGVCDISNQQIEGLERAEDEITSHDQQPSPSTELYDTNNDESEKMPWEISDTQPIEMKDSEASISQSRENQEAPQSMQLFANGDEAENEKMPWETSNTQQTQVKGDEMNLKVKNYEESTDPAELFPTQNDNELERMPWEAFEAKNLPSHVSNFADEDAAPSSNVFSTTQTTFQDKADSSTRQNGSSDKLAEIFDDDALEADDSWLHDADNSNQLTSATALDESLRMEQPSQEITVNTIKKFSFLEDDDDLLDENVSDGSFLASDEDKNEALSLDISATTSVNATVKDLKTPSATQLQQDTDSIDEKRAPSVSSNGTFGGRTSKYEPGQNSQAYRQQATQNLQLQTNPLTPNAYNIAGIVTPQPPIQPRLSTPQPNEAKAQQVVEKIKQEKKKSDAYDFPMDLFPDKNNLSHAKPVGVPKHQLSAVPSYQLPKDSASGVYGGAAGRQNTDRSSPAVPLPKNPYADLVPAKQANVPPQNQISPQGIVPPQGVVPPHISLPSAYQASTNQAIAPPTSQQFAAGNSYSARNRGFSNTSATSASSLGGPTMGPAYPVVQDIGVAPGISQFPQTVRRSSAAKYAPTSPLQPSNAYPPSGGRSLQQNLHNVTPPFPFSGPPQGAQAQTQMPQKFHAPALALHVPINTSLPSKASPTSATSTRRYHARSNSSVYAPNQNEYTSKYAPTVHPQYQNTPPPTQVINDLGSMLHQTGKKETNNTKNTSMINEAMDNQALLHHQFPLIGWSPSDKLIYGIPMETAQGSYIMGSNCSLQNLQIVSIESAIPSSNLLKSFPGPLVKNKVKKKDLEKWLDSAIEEFNESSLDHTILSLLKLRLTDGASWRDVSQCLYNSDELLLYLSQPAIDSKPKPVASKLDANGQMRILAYLQTGGQEKALAIALGKGDYAMALLIGSLMGKDKWSEVVQHYLTNEFIIESDISHFSTNLLSLVFQVFVGNSKTAIQEFYTTSSKTEWATGNWKIIVAAVLNNIGLDEDGSAPKMRDVPPVVYEFLLEFGVFLARKGLNTESCVVFMLANLPLSASPVAGTDVKFEQIGSPLSLEGNLFSELYEFINCSDAKGYPILLPHKLYHAFSLQERGLSSSASRYADYLSGLLKSLPKKEPLVLNVASSLTELSARIAGCSTGWLGKPKLSSVWGQLDKSFNKYIGGDDDAIMRKTAEKKVFDGFTPVPSRSSSMLDVSQYQFTPAQTHIQSASFNNTDNLVPIPSIGKSPMTRTLQGHSNIPLAGTLTEQGPQQQPYATHSTQASPHQRKYSRIQSTSDVVQPQLRRVQTEQVTNLHLNEGQIPANTSIPQTSLNRDIRSNREPGTSFPINELGSSHQISLNSPHYSSTPDLLRRGSSAMSDSVPLPESHLTHNESSKLERPFQPGTPETVNGVQDATEAPQSQETQKTEGETLYKPNNYSQISITGLENLAGVSANSNDIYSMQHHSTTMPQFGAQDQQLQSDSADFNFEHADSSSLPSDIYHHSPEQSTSNGPVSEDNIPKDLSQISKETFGLVNKARSRLDEERDLDGHFEAAEALPPIDESETAPIGGPQMEIEEEPKKPSKMSSRNPYAPSSVGTSNFGHHEEISLNGRQTEISESLSSTVETGIAPPAKSAVAGESEIETRMMNSRNAYTPTSFENLTANAYESGPTTITSNKVAYRPHNESFGIDSETQPNGLDRDVPPVEESTKVSAKRFDPIKPPENLTSETFLPVIKKSSASRAFTPLINESPEIQYDDVVEDESDESDAEEERRLRQKLEEERLKEEEQARRKKEEEKERAKSSRKKEEDKANGWFGWLKKDSNEKKPIKAKLGHKSTFYYDDKLKRWVNKDASEEEKEKIASPPPPPPVVKRMDNGPKTKPIPGPEMPRMDAIGAVVPKNPITGAPLEPTPPAPQIRDDVPSSSRSHPSVNLTGKKANGLDDLLSLTGGTAPRRKKKTGRGYVNVMDSK